MSKDYSPETIKARNKFVKPARFDKGREIYICSHCGSEIPVSIITHGYDCKECDLPFNERL